MGSQARRSTVQRAFRLQHLTPDDFEARIELLTSELDRIDSERHSNTSVFASLIGVVFVVAGGYLALEGREDTPSWLWAAMAIIPMMILAYIVTVFAIGVVHSYYSRTIERRLTEMLQDVGNDLPPSVLETINAATTSSRRGFLELRLIYLVEYTAVAAIVLAGTTAATLKIEPTALQVATGITAFTLLLAAMRLAYRTIVRGRRTWHEISATVKEDLAAPFPRPEPERPPRLLGSYLVVPRPNDLFVKGILLHLVSAMVGVVMASGSIGPAVTHALIGWLAFEYFLYQARYMLNDLLGQEEDQDHPFAVQRKRVRLDTTPRKVWAVIVLCLRLAGAAILLVLLPSDLAFVLGGALLACMVLAAVYELVRNQIGGRELQVPGWLLGTLFAVVALPYGIRAAVGIYLGSGGELPWSMVALVGLTLYFSGMSTVLMAWVLEATCFIGEADDGCSPVSRAVGSKWHVIALGRAAGIATHVQRVDRVLARDELPFTSSKLHTTITDDKQWWNRAYVLACGVAAVTGISIVEPEVWAFGMAGAVGLGLGIATVRSVGLVNLVMPLAAGWIGVAWWTLSDNAWFVPLPLAVVLSTYAATRDLTYLDTINFPERLANLARESWGRTTSFFSELWT